MDEVHEPGCPALTGDDCTCDKYDPIVDKAWVRFCAGIGDGPDAPYPGMIATFEQYYGQSFADKTWRSEASVWAAAWKSSHRYNEGARVEANRYRWLRRTWCLTLLRYLFGIETYGEATLDLEIDKAIAKDRTDYL